MFRALTILLCVCVGGGCGYVAYESYQAEQIQEPAEQTSEVEEPQPEPKRVGCKRLIENGPGDKTHIRLTGFLHGKHFAAHDFDGDEAWEEVYVPFFPAGTKKLGANYGSVIVCFGDIQNKDELNEMLSGADGAIDCEFKPGYQDLDTATYSELASNYSSMDFGKCVILYRGFGNDAPGESINVMLIGAAFGALVSFMVAGWQTFGFFRRAPRQPHHDHFVHEMPPVAGSGDDGATWRNLGV